ncbi:MAG: uroporphyrinogen decarboxylase family protein [Bacteroidota bacterium]
MNKPKEFQPDYTQILEVLHNRRPSRLPLYEHHIDVPFISKALGKEIILAGSNSGDLDHYYAELLRFWRNMTYDALDYEAPVCDILPGHGAIFGGRPGPIRTRSDFEKFPFDDIPRIFWETYTPHLESLARVMPPGMKAYGGCGYGIFETSQDLVGYEQLCVLLYEDPDLFADLFIRTGDLYEKLWIEMVRKYSDLFVFFRMGDDLGFKTSTLLPHETIIRHILPQYKRVIRAVHRGGKKFLLHSCGDIFPVMEEIIACGIDAKHSNEDQIAPFDRWISLYNDRIGLFGGIDVDLLCQNPYDEVFRQVVDSGTRFRAITRGWGLGSGNSIPGYVPLEGFMGMIDAAREIRMNESE